MLWQKESNKDEALYVNIFELSGNRRSCELVYEKVAQVAKPVTMMEKNDEKSLMRRNVGNDFFKQHQSWIDAMEMYNDSLRFATNGSEAMGIAYANRSSCFLRMDMYKECLLDIELAEKNGCPDRLMPKLEERKAKCLKYIDMDAERDHFGHKLSFASHQEFPGISNVLDIEQDVNGPVFVAKEDIDVGQTIAVVDSFHKYLFMRYGSRCNICLKSKTNLIPCPKCTVAMFCFEGCQLSFLHKCECGLSCGGNTFNNRMRMKDVRGILMAIQIFPNVDDLMTFVEKAINSDPNEVPALANELSKYRAFLKLPCCSTDDTDKQFIEVIYVLSRLIKTIPGMESKFSSPKHSRFLSHLIGQHVKISTDNTLQVIAQFPSHLDQDDVTFYGQTGLFDKYFGHSCEPNTLKADCDGKTVCISIRPIKRGERLLQSNSMDLFQSKKQRQDYLWDLKRIVCNCPRCDGLSASPQQREQIVRDPDYSYILSEDRVLHLNEKERIQAVLRRCETFMKKFGRLNWCHEFGMILGVYMKLLHNTFVDPMDFGIAIKSIAEDLC